MKIIVFIVFALIVEIIGNSIVHKSCFIARKTNKPICACWDCKNPCHLWKYNEFPKIKEK